MSNLIELHNITKIYRTVNREIIALKNINLSVLQSEIIGILGKPNTGKSTLISIMGLADLASLGEYYYKQQPTDKISFKERTHIRNHQFGFITHTHFLLSHQSILKNIMLPLRHRGTALPEAESIAIDMLAKVGLSQAAHKVPGQLSNCEQQQVAIARALTNRPAIIFADEPTRGLNTEEERAIFDLLAKLNQQDGCAIVIASENQQAKQYCHRIVAIDSATSAG